MRFGRTLKLATRKLFLVTVKLVTSSRRGFAGGFRYLIRPGKLRQHSGIPLNYSIPLIADTSSGRSVRS
jgi:hypothetical protein